MNTKREFLKPKDLGLTESKRPLNVDGASVCVRALHLNWRQGTVAAKGRSDVAFSNKKPWKQKGTGRARAGSKRSPLWRGGGVIFGPMKRTRTLKTTKKLRSNVLGSMFYGLLENDRVLMLDFMPQGNVPKTAPAFRALKEADVIGKKINLFVSPSDVLVQASFANIPEVQLMYLDECNVYDVARADYIVCLKKDAELFKEMVRKWI